MPHRHRSPRFIPLFLALSMIIGILVGTFYANHYAGNRLSIINTSSNKLNDLLHIIDDQYVDSTIVEDLVEKALPKILKELDPHSSYTSAKEVEAEMQDLKGSFSGIGISFLIYHDTIHVIRVVKNGPSERVGLKPGDCIITVDNEPFTGKNVTEDVALKTLKGTKGSKIRLGIRRRGTKDLLSFVITRGDIPLNTVETAYMVNESTGYLRITSFGETTYAEFLVALARLYHSGMRSLVIDLRENRGGYMKPAIQIANEFLPKNQLILFTKGRKSPREEYRSDGRGSYQSLPLVVLVDQYSASASEIFAGAVQDNDRGMVVGVRTFGKGLVQEPIEFRDGSLLRLTIARYYTPSGRCLQRPYSGGHGEDYEMEMVKRAETGEYFSPDSIRTDESERYKTRIGRPVYGGGGITPDVFVPKDSTGYTTYFHDAYYTRRLFHYAFLYADAHRQELSKLTWQQAVPYLKKKRLPEQFAKYAESDGLPRRNVLLYKSYDLFEQYLFAQIIDNFWGIEAMRQYHNLSDPFLRASLQIFREQRAFPKAPEEGNRQGEKAKDARRTGSKSRANK